MKTTILFTAFAIAALWACQPNKGTTPAETNSSPAKEVSLEGTWEANFIMNAPKPFEELYPQIKPSIIFKSDELRASGNAGCNMFMGSYTTSGNTLAFGENMALTRKMCQDMTGEQTFMETLKKVNAYAISDDGQTLNLLTGDVAVMRLVKK